MQAIFYKPFRVRFPGWTAWIALMTISFAAPVIAVFIHSLCVYERGFRLYNAEIGGGYFLGSGRVEQSSVSSIFELLGFCGIPAILTFLILVPFRRRTLLRWVVWAGLVVLWTVVLFQTEFAISFKI